MPLPEVIAYVLAVLFGIRFVIVKAWYAARNLRPDMNLLMTVAIAGAIVIGEWFEAATVAFLFALSLALESWSVARARRAIAALLDLAPPIVRLLRTDGSERMYRWPKSGLATASLFRLAGASRWMDALWQA